MTAPRPTPVADFAERAKELAFEQRDRLRGAPGAVLSLGLLRAACRRLLTPTLPATARPVPRPAAGTLALTFVGHATVMITTPGVRVLIDPLLGNWLGGLRRAQAAAAAAGDLADVELVLISNAQRDHLSLPSLGLLPRAATLVVPVRCGPLVARLGYPRVIELGTGRSFSFGDVEVSAVPVRATGTRGGRQPEASGYVVRASSGRAVYFAGDTGYFPGFAEIGRRFTPDMALLPIGGYQPAAFRNQHLSPLDAVYAFEDLGAHRLVPIRYGSFPLSYEPLDEPLAWLRALCDQRGLAGALTVLKHGQTCLIR